MLICVYHTESDRPSPSYSKTENSLFTDAENLDKESPYYDAVLELKNEYPKEMSKMIVKEDRKGWKNEVDELPAILLVNDEKVIVKVEGNVRSKQEILSPLCHALDRVNTN